MQSSSFYNSNEFGDDPECSAFSEFVDQATNEFCDSKSRHSVYVNRMKPGQQRVQYKYNLDYVNKVRRKHEASANRKGMARKALGRLGVGAHPQLIMNRLRTTHMPVDLCRRACLNSMCGRSFRSVEVLAYHACYAHQNQASKNPIDVMCLLCGKVFQNVQSKLMHLAMHHRHEAEMHNEQCVTQSSFAVATSPIEAVQLGELPSSARFFDEEDVHEERELADLEAFPNFLDDFSTTFESTSQQSSSDHSLFPFGSEGSLEPEFGVPFVIQYTQ